MDFGAAPGLLSARFVSTPGGGGGTYKLVAFFPRAVSVYASSQVRVLQTMLPSTDLVLQTMFSSPRAVPQTNEPLRSPQRTFRQLPCIDIAKHPHGEKKKQRDG